MSEPKGVTLETVECFNEDCRWTGTINEAAHPSKDPDDLHCPCCLERLS